MAADRSRERALSPSQLEAASSFGKDVVVSAGAGSGKTSVLVSRFVRAVTDLGDAPDRILAITFTEKAANEMKTRLVHEFEALGRQAERRALETAYIGTIHGFCARVLRENPIEAGVDPYFKVLSEGESELLMAKALDTAFEAQADRPLWLSVLVERGERSVRAAILSLYEQFRALGEDEAILRSVHDGFERRKIEDAIARRLNEAAETVDSKKAAAYELATVAAARRVAAVLARGPLDWTGFFDIREAAGSIRKAGRLKEMVEALRDDVEEWKPLALQELFAPQKTEFLRVFGEFRRAYETEKRARATYDFDDLPLLVWKLLTGEAPEKRAVRDRYRSRFRHVFVDEFQDTSPLQAKLIDLLRSPGNLFIVGDRQQSIYAFRHAEPALFSRYEAAAGARVALDENYRSRPAVLSFANAFFADAYPEGTFRPLHAAKKFKLPGTGAVELLASIYGEGEPAEDLETAREAEAEALAARIRELLDSGARIEDGTPGGRPMGFGDVAILLRGTTKAPSYERALARHGIRFYSVKSKGFFDRPEVKDLVRFLALLDHPDDDVSLAALLRSPVGGVSDDGLFWIARAAKTPDTRRPLARAFESFASIEELSAEDRRRASELAEFLEKFRRRKNGLPVSALLEEAIRWSGYECAAATGPGGVQRVANVRKLVEIARSLEEKTPIDAAEFVRYVSGMTEREETEAEARVEAEGGDAVLIASVHASKGLEFPCVAVANLGGYQNFRSGGFVAASAEAGFGWSVSDPEDDRESLADRAYLAASRALRERLDQEEGRLLYVAITRAKERLILSGAVKRVSDAPSKRGGPWMARLLSFAGWDSSSAWRPARESGIQAFFASSGIAAPRAFADETAEFPPVSSVLSRLALPEKPYDLAFDLTVSDLLADASPKERAFADPEEPEEIDLEDAERSPRNEYGTVFHRLMEIMTHATPRGGAIGEEFVTSLLSPLTPAEREEARGAAGAFWKSPLGASIRKSPAVHPELPFIFRTPFGILKGQIDLVYRDASGWVILDYKTNRVDAAGVERAAAEYEFQLALYGLVFWKLYGEAPSKGVLYFAVPARTFEFKWGLADLEDFERRLSEAFRASAAARAGA